LDTQSHEQVIHILLVEDDADLRKTFSVILKKCGFDVTSVSEGLSAVRTFLNGNFEAILMDINLPGINGIDSMHLIHALNPDVPVILLTGCTDYGLRKTTMQEGAYCLLEKPVHIDKLVETIKHAAYSVISTFNKSAIGVK
jgi:two-component system C4-dicarboxylate transport response regulator DctD